MADNLDYLLFRPEKEEYSYRPSAPELIKKELKEKTGKLDLSSQRMKKVPLKINELTHLKSLNLSFNKIRDYSFLENFPNLETLDLSFDLIDKVSFWDFSLGTPNLNTRGYHSLEKLNKLRTLSLRDHKLNDYSFLENLPSLESLDLSKNNLSNCNFLEKLSNLQSLNLSENHIADFNFLTKFSQLQSLTLNKCSIKDITFLEKLSKLEILHLNENYIKDIHTLKKLNNLYILDLSFNYIEDIYPLLHFIEKRMPILLNSIYSLNKGVNQINLSHNPISSPPIEILKQGNEAILRYFAEKEKQGVQKLMEAKLLIVGQGGAGKTSLKRKLHDVNDKMPEPEDTTRGIEVTQLDCKVNNGEDFRLNIWDFGGQNVQHYAHQFFLTGSSLYALVTNEREQNPNFQYWLNIIEMLGGKSPVLIVQNEIAGHSEPIKNAAAIRERFENVVNPFQQVDLSKASTDGRFKNLKEAIIHHALQLPHIGKEYPTSYVRVREALEREAKEKHYITWKDYQELCRAAQVDDPDVMQDIATTFTILGVCLHFKDDAVLRKFVFLNPKWIIDALFELLYHQIVIEQQGQFSENDLARIWSHELYDDMEDKLIRIMENFELCYRIKDSRDYMVPQRLPAEQQSYGWHEPQATRVEYEYKFMPKGIITRLTCRLHEKIEGDHVWNDAVIFEMPKARALVREVYAEEKIAIEVSGEKRADLLNRILDEVDDIHRKSNYANLQVEKKVPCSCAVCSEAKVPYFFNYDYLVELLDDGEYDERCQNSRKKVDIREVLLKTGIDFKKNRRTGDGRIGLWGDLERDGFRAEAEILIKKLNYLRAEKAKSSDAAQIFTIDRQIEETEKRLAEIRAIE